MHGRLPYELIKPDIQLRNLLRSINQRKIVCPFSNLNLGNLKLLLILVYISNFEIVSVIVRYLQIRTEFMHLERWTGWG